MPSDDPVELKRPNVDWWSEYLHPRGHGGKFRSKPGANVPSMDPASRDSRKKKVRRVHVNQGVQIGGPGRATPRTDTPTHAPAPRQPDRTIPPARPRRKPDMEGARAQRSQESSAGINMDEGDPPSHPSTISRLEGGKRIVTTSDPDEAARALLRGDHVELRQPREVSTLLDKLKTLVDDAKSKGEKAPLYDLCKVSVQGTNLFCSQAVVESRLDMPQLSGTPRPGSRADAMEKDKDGKVDITPLFRDHLVNTLGIAVSDETEKASYLRASQRELNGGKVAGMAKAYEAGNFPGLATVPIFVSRDNYVVDGHHRWAALVGVDLEDGVEGDIDMPVNRVDADILTVLAEANKFADEMGIPRAGAGDMSSVPSSAKSDGGCLGCGQPAPAHLLGGNYTIDVGGGSTITATTSGSVIYTPATKEMIPRDQICPVCGGKMVGHECEDCGWSDQTQEDDDMDVDDANDTPKRDVSGEERDKLADRGHAMSDGSFPIANRSDLANAIKAWGRAKDKAAAKRHIIKRARELGAESALPEDWNVKADDLPGTETSPTAVPEGEEPAEPTAPPSAEADSDPNPTGTMEPGSPTDPVGSSDEVDEKGFGRANVNWSEFFHPRDRDGRFANKPGGSLRGTDPVMANIGHPHPYRGQDPVMANIGGGSNRHPTSHPTPKPGPPPKPDPDHGDRLARAIAGPGLTTPTSRVRTGYEDAEDWSSGWARRNKAPWADGKFPEVWGEWQTDEGDVVRAYRGKRNRVRFYNRQGQQVGPEHANVYPAMAAAFAMGWSDMGASADLNLHAQQEVRRNSRPRGKSEEDPTPDTPDIPTLDLLVDVRAFLAGEKTDDPDLDPWAPPSDEAKAAKHKFATGKKGGPCSICGKSFNDGPHIGADNPNATTSTRELGDRKKKGEEESAPETKSDLVAIDPDLYRQMISFRRSLLTT